jgi:hypothetical protein
MLEVEATYVEDNVVQGVEDGFEGALELELDW